MKPYGAKKNARERWKERWGEKPHGSRYKVCNSPNKISVSKCGARRELKEETDELMLEFMHRFEDLSEEQQHDVLRKMDDMLS